MPLIENSSYKAPVILDGPHLQTILPSYFQKALPVNYRREEFNTPDGDFLWLDWANCRTPSKELLIISHGLCGHTRRHYVLSMVHAFRRWHIDCLAWNYRGTGDSRGRLLRMTTNNSTDELSWVVQHAIQCGYEHIYLAGFSMGGNLTMLYLGREAANLPPQVKGGVAFCGTIDPPVCSRLLGERLFGVYQRHFVSDLCKRIEYMHNQYPEELPIDDIDEIRTFQQFDDRYTAPMMGFRDAQDYYHISSAARWLHEIRLPALLVNPANDPFLGGECYPVELAKKSPNFHLEIPASGGHCGFITKNGEEWWPARRAREFICQSIRPYNGLPELTEQPQEDENTKDAS